jgi:hypothetical protein
MKRNTLYLGLTALLLTGAAISPMANAEPQSLLGDPVPSSAAERTVVLGPNTAYVNVTGGEVVKFVVGGKAFAWDFDTADGITSFDLSKVAPAGTLDHKVMVYIARDPTYFGGA